MIGDRIKLARLANALSLQDLADALEEEGLKITRAALSKFETGKLTPNNMWLDAMARVFTFDKCFFFREDYPDIDIHFFQEQNTIQKRESELQAYLQIKLEQQILVDRLLQTQYEPFAPQQISPEFDTCQTAIDALTQTLREQWGNRSQPISSVTGILESNGWYVFEIPPLFEIEAVAGIERNTMRPFLCFSYDENTDKTRFNILKSVGYAFISGQSPEELEEMCCKFSRAVLLPAQAISHELISSFSPDYWPLTLLKRRYGIAKVQMRMRFRDLDLYERMSMKNPSRTVERIQSRKLMEARLEQLYFYEIPVDFYLKVIAAQRKGLLTPNEANFMLPKQITQVI